MNIFRKRDRSWSKQRREFVYLDEVSVTSLIAARDGAIKDTVKETLTRSSEREAKATSGLAMSKIKFGSESRVKNSDTSARETVRKAVIQSTFRDLRIGGEDELLLTAPGPKRRWHAIEHGSLATVADISGNRRKLIRHGQMISMDQVKRGDVLELELTLSAEKTYQLVSAVSSIVEIVKDRESFFGIDKSSYEQAVTILQMIDGLLVGLVPVCGISNKYAVLKLDDEEILVERSLIMPESRIAHMLVPLEIVGVTNFSAYSRDLRRVLFGEEAYTAYVRVESPKLRDKWDPVKLSGVLKSVSLDVTELMSALPDDFSGPNENDANPPKIDWPEVVRDFGHNLACELGVQTNAAALAAAVDAAAATLEDNGELESQRRAFDVVVRAVDTQADREIVRRVRETALRNISVPEGGGQNNLVQRRRADAPLTRKLEVEFVAIYW
ncbi:hypothetical protein ACIA5D_48925 [Actinoplanes sp. NPDC051513]|uniref:DUF6414 family protein n=1 Tax=Actinoplanes sp. NPDC051513 TaxID=3363908 RepID=UPI0037997BEA